MRRLAALLLPVIVALVLVPGAAHADPGTDFSVDSVGDPVLLADGQTGGGVIDIDFSGTPAPSTLQLSFPAGVSLGRRGVYQGTGRGPVLACVRRSAAATCAVPAGTSDLFFVDITVATNTAVGRTDGVGLDIEPVTGTDPDPDNNTATIPVTVIPTAKLAFVLAAPSIGFTTTGLGQTKLPTGVQTKFTCTVTSHGPDTAVDLDVRIISLTSDPTKWDYRLSPQGPVIDRAGGVAIGTLHPGESRTVTFYVTPHQLGSTSTALCQVQSDTPQNLIEPSIDRAGDFGVAAQLTAGPAPTPTPTPSSSSSEGGLANTGVDSTGLGGLAALLLVTGAGALYLGRRRPVRQH